jgi:hypothetical protein
MSNGKKDETALERSEREQREQRDADRLSRHKEGDRGNGGRGDGGPGGKNTRGVGLGDDDKAKREGKIGSINPALLAAMERPTDTGDRECVQPANQNDKLWTADSKARWDEDQPTLTEQLESQTKIAKDIEKDAEKRRA